MHGTGSVEIICFALAYMYIKVKFLHFGLFHLVIFLNIS